MDNEQKEAFEKQLSKELEMIKYQPKSPEQMTDLQTRLNEGLKFFSTSFKELLSKVEQDYQISINLGLDKDNPYVIQPSFIPRNVKEYVSELPKQPDAGDQPVPEAGGDTTEQAPA